MRPCSSSACSSNTTRTHRLPWSGDAGVVGIGLRDSREVRGGRTLGDRGPGLLRRPCGRSELRSGGDEMASEAEMMSDGQWCELHWSAVRQSIEQGVEPINGILASALLFTEWFTQKTQELGEAMPSPTDDDGVTAMNTLMAREAPLCCRLGDTVMGRIFRESVLPEEYRHLPVRQGHEMHMTDTQNTSSEAEGAFRRLYASRYRITEEDARITLHLPCPLCAFPEFLVYQDLEQVLNRDVTCPGCRRTLRLEGRESAGTVVLELVQVDGAPPPVWISNPPRRIGR